jgi:hypothetical protein
MRAWIGIALLSASWSLGVGLYGPANTVAWIVMVVAGTLLLVGAPQPREAWTPVCPAAPALLLGKPYAWVALLLLVPAACLTPWPYGIGPLLVLVGLAVWLLLGARPRFQAFAAAAMTAGIALIVQGIAISLYITGTARCHDAPWPIPSVLAGATTLLGADAVAEGPMIVMHAMRQTRRLAATWDLLLDPATLCFFLGGLVMLGWVAWSSLPVGKRRTAWLRAAGVLASIVVLWSPLRAMLMIAVYLHRAMRFPDSWPLHVMNHFFSPWVGLLLLLAPVLLVWRLVRLRIRAETPPSEKQRAKVPLPARMAPPAPTPRKASGKSDALAATLVLLGAAVLAVAVYWTPTGTRKTGRIMWVERHSTWSPTTHPYDTKVFGEAGSYNYAAAYRYLGRFYKTSQLLESDKIDDATLSRCDVLVIKIPDIRYSEDEVAAIVRFVQKGGGLLLIGDHTNLERSAAYMNDISRYFGFTFRDDLLFGTAGSPYDEHYEAPPVPHLAVQHVPWFDFAVSCSVDPGWSNGRAAVLETGLWSMPSDYHMSNYHPIPQHCPEMRYGAFVQSWAARYGRGRAVAWGDSTIFSNFCLFQPGKSEMLVNILEWLNHSNDPLDPTLPLVGLGTVALAAGLWMARRRPAMRLVLLAAALCGWSAAAAAVGVEQRWAMPMPAVAHEQVRVTIDRTTSQVPLAQGAFNESEHGYGMLEQWIPRLGYFTVRASGPDAFSGNALVILCPSQSADRAFLDRLVKYVADGGKLLVVDSPENTASTADSLLRPFGLSLLRGKPWSGTMTIDGRWPGIAVQQAWEVAGGEPLARIGGRTIGATVKYGKGTVVVVGFGSLFDDTSMGHDWMELPDGEMLLRYQTLFTLVQSLVEGKAVAAPAGENVPEAKAAGGKMPHDQRPKALPWPGRGG